VRNVMGEHLLAKIRARIDYNILLFVFDQHTDTQTFIAWVSRAANLALASDHRYSDRSACAKQRDSHSG
jgi:hypothetical protein